MRTMHGIDDSNHTIVLVHLDMQRLQSLFSIEIARIWIEEPVVDLPQHLRPCGIKFPQHYARCDVPHAMISSFIHRTIAARVDILCPTNIIFGTLWLSELPPNSLIIRLISITFGRATNRIPCIMIGPNAIQRIISGLFSLAQTIDIFLHAGQGRHRRHTHLVAKHLVFHLQNLVIVIRMWIPSVVGRILIGHACGQIGLDIRCLFVHIPAVT